MELTAYILFLTVMVGLSFEEDLASQIIAAEIQDYCIQDPYFEPRCEAGQVIVVKHARYGRMRQSRCITNSGAMGCSVDVKDILHEQCSGRRSCQLVVGVTQPKNNPPCDAYGYLEVAFTCVKVVQALNPAACQATRVLEIRLPRGYLSSYNMAGTGCASEDNPLQIIARPGQSIRLKLLYFGPLIKSRSNVCHVLALVQNKESRNSESLCAGESRETLVHTSSSNALAVTFVTVNEPDDRQSHFLIEFEAVGCADPSTPTNGWMKISGDDVNMGCHNGINEVKQWRRRCDGTRWIGDTFNCSTVKSAPSNGKQTWTTLMQSRGFYILAAIGIVVLVSLCILMLALIYIRRRWKRGIREPDKIVQDARREGKTARHSLISAGKGDEYYCSPGSDYYGTQRTWPRGCPTSKPSSTATKAVALPPYATVCRKGRHGEDEHEYEIPQLNKNGRTLGEGHNTTKSRKYYELDPNCTNGGDSEAA